MICKVGYKKTKDGLLRVNFKCRNVIGSKVFIYQNTSGLLKHLHLDIMNYIQSNGGKLSNVRYCRSFLKSLLSSCVNTIKATLVFDLKVNSYIGSIVEHASEILEDEFDEEEDEDGFDYDENESDEDESDFDARDFSIIHPEPAWWSHGFGRTPPITGCR